MTRSRLSPVRPALALGSLVLLAACSADSLPTQPPSFGSAAPAGAETADYVADSWANKTAMPTARRGLVTATDRRFRAARVAATRDDLVPDPTALAGEPAQ